jgi:hypothetical protein
MLQICYHAISVYDDAATTLYIPPPRLNADEAEVVTATMASHHSRSVILIAKPGRPSTPPSCRRGPHCHRPVPHPHIVKPRHPFAAILHQSSCTTLPGVRMEEDPIPLYHSSLSIDCCVSSRGSPRPHPSPPLTIAPP